MPRAGARRRRCECNQRNAGGHSDESINHCGPTFEAELDGGHGFRAWAGYVRSERLPRVARATGFTHAQTDRTRA